MPVSGMAEEWRYTVTPYVWGASVDATLDIDANPPTDGDGSVLDVLDGAFFINAEVRRGAWAVVGEYNYLNLSDEIGTTSLGNVAGWRLKGNMGSLAASYAVLDTQNARVEALAGLRGWSLDTSTTVLSRTQDSSNTWVDPIVGFRFSVPLSNRFGLAGGANVGGFGVGSDFQWDAVAQVQWQATDTVTFSGGYRHLYLDFINDETVIDMTLSGPFVAASFNF